MIIFKTVWILITISYNLISTIKNETYSEYHAHSRQINLASFQGVTRKRELLAVYNNHTLSVKLKGFH